MSGTVGNSQAFERWYAEKIVVLLAQENMRRAFDEGLSFGPHQSAAILIDGSPHHASVG